MSDARYHTETEGLGSLKSTNFRSQDLHRREGSRAEESSASFAAAPSGEVVGRSCWCSWADDLDVAVDSDQPRKIVEKEPDSVAAFVPSFGQPQPCSAVRATRSASARSSRSASASRSAELLSYRNDIRKIPPTTLVKDRVEQEDTRPSPRVMRSLAAAPAQVVGAPRFLRFGLRAWKPEHDQPQDPGWGT